MKKKKYPNWWYLLNITLSICIVWLSSAVLIETFVKPERQGITGDMFGAVNALFTGLAFAFFVYTILLQREELKLQRKEFKLQREATEKLQKDTATQAENFSQNVELVKQQIGIMAQDDKRQFVELHPWFSYQEGSAVMEIVEDKEDKTKADYKFNLEVQNHGQTAYIYYAEIEPLSNHFSIQVSEEPSGGNEKSNHFEVDKKHYLLLVASYKKLTIRKASKIFPLKFSIYFKNGFGETVKDVWELKPKHTTTRILMYAKRIEHMQLVEGGLNIDPKEPSFGVLV